MRQWHVVFLTVVVLGFVGCGSNDSEKGSQEVDQAPAETTQEATREKTRETTREATRGTTSPERKTAPKESTAAKSSSKADEDAGAHDATARVTNVVDGDTVDISPAVDGIDRVRFIGVDTPETRECPGGQPFSQEAKTFTTTELQGQEVGLEFDVERTDQYDRLLAYVYEDGEMFNEDLLEGGYAQVATFPPNTRYVERFEAAQERARAAGIGIWGLSPEELAQLEDRGNGIGGAGCSPTTPPPPPPLPPPPLPPPPVAQPEPDIPSAPSQPVPGVAGGADCSTGVKDVPVAPGSKGDRDRDGVACES